MPGSILGAGASLGAASMQADAANRATDTQLAMYNQTRGDLLPYNQGGQQMFGNLMGLMGQGGIPNTGSGPISPVPGYGSYGNQGIPTYQGVPYGAQALQAYNAQQPIPGVNGAPPTPGSVWAAGTPGTTEQQNFATSLFPNSGSPTQYSVDETGNRLPAFNYANAVEPGGFTGMGGMGGTGNPMLDALRRYPGYQFAQEEGVRALDRSAASRGQVLSGGQLRAVDRYGTGLADQLFGKYFDQNYQLASLGENAAAQTGNAGSNAANGAASAQMAAGQAWSSGIAGAANNIGGALPSWNPFGSSGGGSTGNWSGSIMDDGTVISDRRAKTEIKPVGKLESGLAIYSYRLRGQRATHLGVMSDEVRAVAPHAVKRHPDGLDRVDYHKISMLPPFKKAA